ncbi:MAG: P1 family peptidase [Cohaesibacter sp.]|nr:P1 family peptidase [Cohaesibacter sp.]
MRLGHVSLRDGAVQTGVSAVHFVPGNPFEQKCVAASHVINGFGKSVGLLQLDELGQLETPIVLTNTLSVGTASDALVRYTNGIKDWARNIRTTAPGSCPDIRIGVHHYFACYRCSLLRPAIETNLSARRRGLGLDWYGAWLRKW